MLSLLSQEDGCIRKLPKFADIDIQSMTDLFMIKTPRSLLITGDKPAAIFQVRFKQSNIVFQIYGYGWKTYSLLYIKILH